MMNRLEDRKGFGAKYPQFLRIEPPLIHGNVYVVCSSSWCRPLSNIDEVC